MRRFYILLLVTTTLYSCWPKDEIIPPKYNYIPPELKVTSLNHSIYDHQIYYNFEKNETESINSFNDWDIGFESSEAGQNIIMNSSQLIGIANLGNVDFGTTTEIPDGTEYVFDASSGNPDSLAINNWVDATSNPYKYSNELFVLGKKNGLDYVPLKKMKFIELTNTYYKILVSDMNDTNPDTVIINKDHTINFTKVKLGTTTEIVDIEPNKENWNILFTQYQTILFTEDGIPTPYSVRGILTNPFKTEVAKLYISKDSAANDSIVDKRFIAIDSTIVFGLEFNSNWDAIGWDWKDVEIDQGTNTAQYKADPRKVYILNHDGIYYKIHFTSFYKQGEKGYPSFKYGRLNKEQFN